MNKNTANQSLRKKMSIESYKKKLRAVLVQEPIPLDLPPKLQTELEVSSGTKPQVPDGCDLFTLWSSMVTLSKEVKLQGRSFNKISNQLEMVTGLPENINTLERGQDKTRQIIERLFERLDSSEIEKKIKHAAEQVRREAIDPLIDIRDRLSRGLEGARAAIETQKMEQDKNETLKDIVNTLTAFYEGYLMSFNRVDQLLKSWMISEIQVKDRFFNPSEMKAIDIEESQYKADGLVSEVYRAGYMQGDTVYRPAEVKVVKACPLTEPPIRRIPPPPLVLSG